MNRLSLFCAAGVVAVATGAHAQTAPQVPAPAAKPPAAKPTASEVVITARRLDQARDSIQPQLGASTYTVTAQAIEALPGGENADMNQVLLQAPGVAQDSYGQLHVRGEHNGLQYRLDGIILPEGLSVFSQALSPRLANSVELITGALPAEYGLHTAGIIDITTKTGTQPGGQVSIYGGSHSDLEPSFEYGGQSGDNTFFVSGSYKQNDLGIESPDGRSDPIHDWTTQINGFAYFDHIIDADNRVSVIVGTSDNHFQIPDVSGGLNGGLGLSVNGQTNYPSEQLNENQAETTQYGVVSWLHAADRYALQVSVYGRYSTLKYTPDVVGDILYNGIAQTADKTDTDGGVQVDGSYRLGSQHTLRGGLVLEAERSLSQTTSQVMLINNNPNDPNYGSQIGQTPFTIVDNGGETAYTLSVYLQDEWKLLSNLTLNYGLRFDEFDGFRNENQLSPRINIVWLPLPDTTFHAGYARYFSPPPFELVGQESVSKFTNPTGNPLITSSGNPLVGSSGALVAGPGNPLVTADTTPYAERANYFDVGAQQKFGRRLTVGLDSYYKADTDLVDEGQFGAPIILTPFNYKTGYQWGLELTGSYVNGPFNAYANLSHTVAEGKDWITSQFDFSQAAIDYVASHYILLDHDEAYSLSAGASYLWRGTRFGGDLIYGSGLRADLPLANPVTYPDGSVLTAIPNGAPVQSYVQINLALSHRFELTGGAYEVRLDVVNLLDDEYQIRTGSGVGVFAPQYGPRRGIFAGVTRSF